jgi:hypothetical protein
MTDEWSSLLALWDKNIPTIAFGSGFLVEAENIGNFAIKWCDFLHFTLCIQEGECFRTP